MGRLVNDCPGNTPANLYRRKTCRSGFLFGVSLLAAISISVLEARAQTQGPPAKRSITLPEAVEIFMQRNLQLVAARYDIDTADAEKLTARLRPNPEFSFSSSDLPLNLSGPLIKEQTYDYGISQTFEL